MVIAYCHECKNVASISPVMMVYVKNNVKPHC